MKRTGSSNEHLRDVIASLRKASIEQNCALWKKLAAELERPSRQRRNVNLGKIARVTRENDFIIVPGKVLGSGAISHKLTISAYQFSGSAIDKLKQAGASIVPMPELFKEKPDEKRMRIIG
ncbi:50S ribosomal protein L18e [Candidatus Woesearchaeota archaeon]|nr:50S ribosomal protein L18e [Candidatus Woesearchaeota archaeon]